MLLKMNNLKRKIQSEIIHWNNKFPLDYWWRQKYKVPFGSKRHTEMSLLDMFRDYLEEQLIKKSRERAEKEQNPDYIPQEEIDRDFENLDISKY